MAAKKKTKRQNVPKEHKAQPSPLHVLFSSLQSPKGLEKSNLKALYAAMVHLSSTETESGLELLGVKLGLGEVHKLSDVLFSELETRFQGVFPVVSAGSGSGKDSVFRVDVRFHVEGMCILLRCCLVLLVLMPSLDQRLVVEKGRVLLSVLKMLFALGFFGADETGCVVSEKLDSRECASVSRDQDDNVLESSGLGRVLVCAMLEVFADELLLHSSLRDCLMLVDSIFPKCEMLFSSHFAYGNIGIVLEVVCAHFILSTSDDKSFLNFISRLFWNHCENVRIPEISLPVALSLLQSPVVLSAPKILLAHLILLVSEVIGTHLFSKNMNLDVRVLDYYSTAFETSVMLYTRHMPSLRVDGLPLCSGDSSVASSLPGKSGPSFESLLNPGTRDKLHHTIIRLNKSWESYINISFKTNSQLVAASMAYVKESLSAFDESSKDKIVSILSRIIVRASSEDNGNTVLHKQVETGLQDIYLLAALLKLMSSSMLQAVQYARSLRSSHMEYDFILGVTGCFEQFNIQLPVQKFLSEVMQSHPTGYSESKWMLLHFSGLLSISYDSRLDFLVKDCLFTMMVVLNFFTIKGVDFCMLESLLASTSESNLSENVKRIQITRKSSLVVASKFQKIQELHSRINPLKTCNRRENQDLDMSLMEGTTETCNGESFLRILLGQNSQPSDVDELADFIQCEPGKDYSRWLKDRLKFREWKFKKMAALRRKKKSKAWHLLRGR